MNTFSHVPPGFRFHPTDEELVDYYLRKKIASKRIDLDVIKDVDLYRIEPWDLQELCRLGTEEQNEWYFFSHKDKKYPTGTRTNRATKAGFWKATGRDKAIYARHCLVGMRKTLVFYKGRAPNGQKSDWIMHEYRLETNENGSPQEEGWVVCRVFKKRMTTVQKMSDYDHSPYNWYDDHISTFMPPELYNNSPRRLITHQQSYHNPNLSCKQELELHFINNMHHNVHDSNFLQLPQLESPNKAPNLQDDDRSSSQQGGHHVMMMMMMNGSDHCINVEQAVDQVTDWRVLDKFVASQLSHEDVSKDTTTTTTTTTYVSTSGQEHVAASVSASSCQIDLWK